MDILEFLGKLANGEITDAEMRGRKPQPVAVIEMVETRPGHFERKKK